MPLWILFILSLHLFNVLSAHPSASIEKSCEARIALWCGEGQPTRPVCGTDDLTYSSRCDLVKEQCRREVTPVLPGGDFPKLYMKNKGPCRKIERARVERGQSCWSSRSAAEKGQSTFIPRCLSDGTFAPVQCHKATNTCWCVNQYGKPISKVLVKDATPDCSRPGKRRQGIHLRGSLSMTTRRKRRDCGPREKYNFFTELGAIYRAEYNRTLKSSTVLPESGMSHAAIEWKFSTEDKDGDGVLNKQEYSALRRLLKKVVKPRECARDWLLMCDSDNDAAISRSEWVHCHSPPPPPLPPFQPNKRRNGNGGGRRNRDRQRNLGIVTPGKNPPVISSDMFGPSLQEKVPLMNTNMYNQGADETNEKPDHQEVNDCLSDKRQFLEEFRPNEQLYVPQCAPDGRYQRIQCYNSTGYCWCVHEDTGKPIPGTSVKDLNPNCDAIPSPPRPMKGCPEPKKQAFLKDLMDYMNQTMLKKEFSIEHSPGSVLSSGNVEEKIATSNFLALDENKNKVLERKEWKAFRTAMQEEKKLRRCGKKLPRYCDVNHDKKITLTEWLNCVRSQKPSPGDGKRKGKNPIESILKDD